jgi:rhamnulokinase
MNISECFLAVDIGASGGRHILGGMENGRLALREVYRFNNGMLQRNGHLCWDSDALFSHILKGLRICGETGTLPESVGIDTWGVDFALLDADSRLLGETVAYRDKRTDGMEAVLARSLPFDELYARTGIQRQPFNTIYQLAALRKDAPEQLENAVSLLMMPDYFGFLLTGEKRQEYTNATTTGLVSAEARQWDSALIDRLGLPARLFGPLSMPKSTVGRIRKELAETVGFDCAVVLPATHDTGSAFLAVPAPDDRSVCLSSGTWSLLGVEIDQPILTEESRCANFTNEGGFGGRYRFLKNIMGLWMLQSIRREQDRLYTYPELAELAQAAGDIGSRVDVNDAAFLSPDSMSGTVRAYCAKTDQPVPETTGQLLQVVYQSLASCYARAIRELSGITGKEYRRINIVGGGSRDAYLNQLTADAAGLPVFAGPTEGTALGNILAQQLAAGVFKDLAEARATVNHSFDITEYKPSS